MDENDEKTLEMGESRAKEVENTALEAFLKVEEQLQLSREDADRKRSFVSQLQSDWGNEKGLKSIEKHERAFENRETTAGK